MPKSRSLSDSFSEQPAPATYQVGGALPLTAPSYVEREADETLYQALKSGEFCHILNSRQMGKSSLQVRVMARLQQVGIRCVSIDLTTLGNRHIAPEQWYASIIHDLAMGFSLRLDFIDWWESCSHLSLNKRLSLFFEQILLVQIQHSIVVFIDEIDSILSLPFPCDDFFVLLRACYNRRATSTQYGRLTFAFAGVAAPADFMLDKQRTPFNIGYGIELGGFSFERSTPLLSGLEPVVSDAGEVLQQILYWTNGQPFLTQKLCQIVASHFAENPQSSATVLSLVHTAILDNWEAKDEPEHLRTIRNRILSNTAIAGNLLGLYQQVLASEPAASDMPAQSRIAPSADPVQIELKLSGLVIEQQGWLRVKNPIYRRVFDTAWIEQQLADLRPYALEFEQWLAAQGKDERYLLEGLALKAALTWAEDKQLSAVDYQFLSLSQEQGSAAIEQTLASETLQREQAQIALQAAEDAAEMVGTARRLAKQTASSAAGHNRWVLGLTVAALVVVSLLRWTGILQPLEWAMFDAFTRLRPASAPDERIAIIAVDETSIQALGMFPLSDQVLAELIERINQHQPSMIGLDIYRDLPVAPGTKQLNEQLATTSNLVGIEKVVGTRILPPPGLKSTQQHGFADQVLDGDGTVRRGLLSIYQGERLYTSLALQLATGYLVQRGIEPKPLPDNHIQWGQSVLTPLVPHSGGYVRADTGGYQVLLNYWRDAEQFEIFSLQTVLQDQIPAGALRDRIVLIGVTAPTVNDLLLTPYSRKRNGVPTQMPGVLLHANLVSQLLSAAIDGQPLMQVWPAWLSYGWVALWTFLGALLGSWQHRWLGAIALLTLGMGLAAACYGAFVGSWWIPWVPAALGFGLAAGTLALVTARRSDRQQLRLATIAILNEQANNPAAAKIALEYLKQAENQRNQKRITDMIENEQSAVGSAILNKENNEALPKL